MSNLVFVPIALGIIVLVLHLWLGDYAREVKGFVEKIIADLQNSSRMYSGAVLTLSQEELSRIRFDPKELRLFEIYMSEYLKIWNLDYDLKEKTEGNDRQLDLTLKPLAV